MPAAVHDEVHSYLQARYVVASEAFWHLAGFSIHDQYPTVQHLDVHVPGEQSAAI